MLLLLLTLLFTSEKILAITKMLPKTKINFRSKGVSINGNCLNFKNVSPKLSPWSLIILSYRPAICIFTEKPIKNINQEIFSFTYGLPLNFLMFCNSYFCKNTVQEQRRKPLALSL